MSMQQLINAVADGSMTVADAVYRAEFDGRPSAEIIELIDELVQVKPLAEPAFDFDAFMNIEF